MRMSATSARRELLRRPLAAAEHLAHLRARQEDVAPRRSCGQVLPDAIEPHVVAEERVLEHQRLDAERRPASSSSKIALRVVGAVVGADAGVVAADDEVRAAVVLAADRVQDRLARAAVAHGGRERREQRAVRRVVVLEQRVVAVARARRAGTSSPFVSPTSGWTRRPSTISSARLRDVLVRAVDRVARLEPDDALPAALGEGRARLGRGRARGRGTAAWAARTP